MYVHAATVDVDEDRHRGLGGDRHRGAKKGLVTRLESAPPIPLHVDHPFLWWIQENTTGTILFMGRVVDPRSEGTGGGGPE